MDYKKLSDTIRLCGSTPKIDQCKAECPYYAGGDMMKCIPVMTKDAADAIDNLFKEREKAIKILKKITYDFEICTGCKHLGEKCYDFYYWCEDDCENHWEWEGL